MPCDDVERTMLPWARLYHRQDATTSGTAAGFPLFPHLAAEIGVFRRGTFEFLINVDNVRNLHHPCTLNVMIALFLS